MVTPIAEKQKSGGEADLERIKTSFQGMCSLRCLLKIQVQSCRQESGETTQISTLKYDISCQCCVHALTI